MAQLTENECDLVAEQSGGIFETFGQGLDGADGRGEVGRRGKIAQSEHGAVPLEQGKFRVKQRLLHLGDGGLARCQRKRRGRVDGGEITALGEGDH